MSNWMNEAGEPYMTAAELRFEAELDAQSAYERQFDDFYDRDDEPEDCDPDYDLDLHDGYAWCYAHDQRLDDCQPDEPWPMEDQWLDSYMEDRMTTMFEG